MSEALSQAEIEKIVVQTGRRAVFAALDRHARLGESVVIWRDGKVVEIAPEDIPALLKDDSDEDSTQPSN